MIVLDSDQPDDAALQNLFTRQCMISVIVTEMAQRLYEARGLWIGGHTIPWIELDTLRKLDYRNEIERLIKRT